MNDTTDSPVEIRLRATLRAVAAAPVADDFADLRRHSTESTITWSDPGGSRRTHRMLAAAVLVVVAVTAAAVMAVLARDNSSEPVITDDPPPAPATGFVLPTGLGTDWELVGVMVEPVSAEPNMVRRASFASTEPPLGGSGDTTVQIDAEVSRVTDARPLPSRDDAQPVPRGTGDDARTYWVATGTEATGRVTDAHVEATVGDLLLTLFGLDVGEVDPLLELADRWWESDGEVLAVDPSLGLRRTMDWTYPTSTADPADPDRGSSEPETGLVQLVLRTPAGRTISLTLSVPGAVPRPTGIDDPDRGAAAGLAEEDRPRRVEVPHLDAPGWVWDGNVPLVAVELPTVIVGLSGLADEGDGDGPIAPAGAVAATLDELLELLDALEPVDAARWAEAVRPVDGGPEAVAADLASLFRSPPDTSSGPDPTPGG